MSLNGGRGLGLNYMGAMAFSVVALVLLPLPPPPKKYLMTKVAYVTVNPSRTAMANQALICGTEAMINNIVCVCVCVPLPVCMMTYSRPPCMYVCMMTYSRPPCMYVCMMTYSRPPCMYVCMMTYSRPPCMYVCMMTYSRCVHSLVKEDIIFVRNGWSNII